MMNTIRIFFAVMLPVEVCVPFLKPLGILKKAIRGHSIRWTSVNHFHVTLQFLKDLQQKHTMLLIEEVQTQLKNMSAFQLQLGQLSLFPTPELPRIISLTVEPQTVLMAMSNTIGKAISALGYSVESRPFQGHITIARLHHDKLQADLLSHIHFPVIKPIPVHKIYLIESRPDNEGSNYVTLAQFTLNQNQPDS